MRVKAELTRYNYELYFTESKGISLVENRGTSHIASLVVELRSLFHAEHVQKHFDLLIRKFACSEIWRQFAFRYVGREESR